MDFTFVTLYNYSVNSGFPAFPLRNTPRNLALVEHLFRVRIISCYFANETTIMVWIRHVDGRPMFRKAEFIRPPYTHRRYHQRGVIVCTSDKGYTFNETGLPYIIFIDR